MTKKIYGIEVQCSECAKLIDVWTWKHGDPIPEGVICGDCCNDLGIPIEEEYDIFMEDESNHLGCYGFPNCDMFPELCTAKFK